MPGTCPTCKGSGKQNVKFQDFTASAPTKEETLTITCVRCDGSGEDTGRQFVEDLVTWCSCPCDGQVLYVADGECDWVVNGAPCPSMKHHWHCAVCQGVVQIG